MSEFTCPRNPLDIGARSQARLLSNFLSLGPEFIKNRLAIGHATGSCGDPCHPPPQVPRPQMTVSLSPMPPDEPIPSRFLQFHITSFY